MDREGIRRVIQLPERDLGPHSQEDGKVRIGGDTEFATAISQLDALAREPFGGFAGPELRFPTNELCPSSHPEIALFNGPRFGSHCTGDRLGEHTQLHGKLRTMRLRPREGVIVLETSHLRDRLVEEGSRLMDQAHVLQDTCVLSEHHTDHPRCVLFVQRAGLTQRGERSWNISDKPLDDATGMERLGRIEPEALLIGQAQARTQVLESSCKLTISAVDGTTVQMKTHKNRHVAVFTKQGLRCGELLKRFTFSAAHSQDERTLVQKDTEIALCDPGLRRIQKLEPPCRSTQRRLGVREADHQARGDGRRARLREGEVFRPAEEGESFTEQSPAFGWTPRIGRGQPLTLKAPCFGF
ncbi:hypothetical protein Afil01_08970 [Actinorhabdospora filicis]|uniref:Uncharacterized protein n=1 Tax=Actinorhabdospora filicis TaxID=1785913 RepID=A0A9W6SF95_9ACTN|nr:hypothetical protein Afil01_08970 [Actinorhabdospora filicis]